LRHVVYISFLANGSDFSLPTDRSVDAIIRCFASRTQYKSGKPENIYPPNIKIGPNIKFIT